MDSGLEKRLYEKYNIDNLSPGSKTAKLGHLYEEYVKIIFSTNEYIDNFNQGCQPSTVEEEVIQAVCKEFNIEFIASVDFLEVPSTDAGGPAKTDLCILINENIYIKSTIKQSHCKRVSISEYDVATIAQAVSIKDQRVISLMEKFQRCGSGKLFSESEKEELTLGIQPYKRDLIRWAFSGDVSNSHDLRVANFSINFKVNKETKRMEHFVAHSIDSLVNKTIEEGNGFDTGLSWTHASGTRGKKIQYKGPTFL